MTVDAHGNRDHSAQAVRRFGAPGRINIIGEHTDYNDGFVLPTNTALHTMVEATPRDDRLIKVITRTFDDAAVFSIGAYDVESPLWLRYVKGVAARLEAADVSLAGADLVLDGDIPIGGGLSSSASLELAVAHALAALAGVEIAPDELARICQQAEIEFAGVNCGLMDQFSVACGQYNTAMLLDCRDLQTEFVKLPENMSLVVTDSGVKHRHPDSGYNDRAAECGAAVKMMQKSGASIQSLRDVSLIDLEAVQDALGDKLFRRARHVITENTRTLDAAHALREGDIVALGLLVTASHNSLRDDYEVSCDGIENLIELTSRCDGVEGSRMVGGGFGGCVLSVVDREATSAVVEKIRSDYGSMIGIEPWIHIVTPTDAAGEIIST